MNNTKNWNFTIKRICTFLLLLTLFIQIVSIIFIESDVDICSFEEVHEISGYIFLGLMILHIVSHFKSLKKMSLSKTK
jgi:hypothetical protein